MPLLFNSPDRAVEFGRNIDMGLDPQKAFPYIYTLVPSREDRWPYSVDMDGVRTYNNMAGMGPAVQSGEIRTFQVVLDSDLIYMMKWVRFTVYWYDSRTGFYEWYEPGTADMIDGQMDPNTVIGSPLLRSLKIGIHVEPSGQYIAGAPDAATQIPQRVSPVTIQGFDTGIGQVNIPRLCPANGMIVFTIENTHAIKTLIVGGCIYGYKIRM